MTVAELIKKLKEMPPQARVSVRDSDGAFDEVGDVFPVGVDNPRVYIDG